MRLTVVRHIGLERRVVTGREKSLDLGNPLIVSSTDIGDRTAERIAKDNPNLVLRPYKFNGGIVYVFCDRSFDFPEAPYASGSVGRSQAIYLARRGVPYEGFLVQMLDSNKHTSGHEHHEQVEIYFPLEGECFIDVQDKKYKLETEVHVNIHEWHQVTTEKMPSLAFIAMLGYKNSLSQDDHHHKRCEYH